MLCSDGRSSVRHFSFLSRGCWMDIAGERGCRRQSWWYGVRMSWGLCLSPTLRMCYLPETLQPCPAITPAALSVWTSGPSDLLPTLASNCPGTLIASPRFLSCGLPPAQRQSCSRPPASTGAPCTPTPLQLSHRPELRRHASCLSRD